MVSLIGRLPLAIVLLLTACGAPEPASQDRFYALEPQITTAAGPSAGGATLMVNALAARGFLGGRQIVYRTAEEPLQVQRYNQLLWEEPPGRALAQTLVAALRAARLFAAVVTPAQSARTDYLLGGEITRFEHRPTDQPPRVSADFTLTLVRGGDRRSIITKRFEGEEPTNGDDPQAMIRAFDRLSARLLSEAVRDLQGIAPRLRAGAGG